MGSLVIVRHGQASLGSDDYDQLSVLGQQQSRLLGEYWGRGGHGFDQVLVGPLRRHRQTLEQIIAGHGDDAVLRGALGDEALREHQAVEVIRRVLATKATGTSGAAPSASLESDWFAHFDRIMRDWIAGRVAFEDLESWQEARERVAGATRRLLDSGSGRVLAVSSGGFACMAVGQLLGLPDLAVYELALELRNAAWVEIRIPATGQPRLVAFNAHPHLDDPRLHTLV